MMEVCPIRPEDIEVGDRHRKLNKKRVKQIAESMKAIGLQHPIHVYQTGTSGTEPIHLVAGRHRLAAALDLGWEQIDCFFVNMDELDRELWQIDENLMRADLTGLERASHTAKRAKIIKARKQLLAKSAKKPAAHRPDEGQADFDKETAETTGRSARAVRADKRRGEKIAPDVQAGTTLCLRRWIAARRIRSSCPANYGTRRYPRR